MNGADITPAEKSLRWALRINGAITSLALLAVFMPLDWMKQTNDYLQIGPVPSGALFEYLARTVSAMYAIHGGLCFVLARDVRRFGPVITYVACVEMAFAGVVLWIDWAVHMPRAWVAVEAPTVVAVSGTILFLRIRARS